MIAATTSGSSLSFAHLDEKRLLGTLQASRAAFIDSVAIARSEKPVSLKFSRHPALDYLSLRTFVRQPDDRCRTRKAPNNSQHLSDLLPVAQTRPAARAPLLDGRFAPEADMAPAGKRTLASRRSWPLSTR
jgi:hypothetical protein